MDQNKLFDVLSQYFDQYEFEREAIDVNMIDRSYSVFGKGRIRLSTSMDQMSVLVTALTEYDQIKSREKLLRALTRTNPAVAEAKIHLDTLIALCQEQENG